MKVLLLVQREEGTEDTCWVVDAADEYTLEEWNGALPDDMQAKINENPVNVRPLWLDIPEDSLEKAFAVPTVTGQISDPQPEMPSE